jgi:hypothetical protein
MSNLLARYGSAQELMTHDCQDGERLVKAALLPGNKKGLAFIGLSL